MEGGALMAAVEVSTGAVSEKKKKETKRSGSRPSHPVFVSERVAEEEFVVLLKEVKQNKKKREKRRHLLI